MVMGSGEFRYPGFEPCDTVIQNISCYRHHELGSHSISFDIERIIRWDEQTYELFPFKYSYMIDVDFPVKNKRKQRNEYVQKASRLKGFHNYSLNKDYVGYQNPEHYDIFTNWIRLRGNKEITIGVIQDKELPTLELVISSLPYGVKVLNKVSPYKLDQRIVNESVRTARKNNKIMPRNRIEEKEEYEKFHSYY